MLAAAVTALTLASNAAFYFTQNQINFAAAVLAGAACQHVVNKVPLQTVSLQVSLMLSEQNINLSVVKEPDVQEKAQVIFESIKTKQCLP